MKQYNSLDMYDMATLAQADLEWLSIALTDVRKRVAEVKKEVMELCPTSVYRFHKLEKILEMYEFIAEEREQHHVNEAHAYKKELEEDEGQA